MDDITIKKFLEVYYGTGSGASGTGYGSGYGDGNGSGTDAGAGAGYGWGYGSGAGSGSGTDAGAGYGWGYGFGYGSGSGTDAGAGYGWGYCYKINGDIIYNIDNTPTIIKSVKGNIAKGYIINNNLTMSKTYIVKNESVFAHGKTIAEAMESLEEKIMSKLEPAEIIEKFLKQTEIDKSYRAQYFFDWHGKLTGSCKQGRESFVKNKNISLDTNMNVYEFIEICKNDYGKDIIKMLADRIAEVRK
jgi:hypothetical protein